MSENEFEQQVDEMYRACGGGRGEPVVFSKAAIRSMMRSDLEHLKLLEIRHAREMEKLRLLLQIEQAKKL